MDTLWLAVRNLFRARARALIVVLVLSADVMAFVTLAQISGGIGATLEGLRAQVGTVIELRAAGATGMGRGADPLPEGIVDGLQGQPGVTTVERYLFSRSENPGGRFPVWVVVGMEPGTTLRINSHGEVGTPSLVAGRALAEGDRDRKVAMVGKVWAEEYTARTGQPVELGSVVRLEGAEIVSPEAVTVVAIYAAGFVFGDSQVIVPLPLAQRLTGKEGRVTNVYVTAGSVDRVPEVVDLLRARLGDRVDVLSGQDYLDTLRRGLGAIQANARASALVAGLAGSLIGLLVMALVTRERTWEIGMLKAMGASTWDVVAQFAAEAGALGLASVLVGLALFALVGGRLGGLFLGTASFTLPIAIPGFEAQQADQLGITFALSSAAIGYAAAAGLLLAVAGSLYPVWRALRLRPAEALRHV